MTKTFWEIYAKPIRDKIVELIQARAQGDDVQVGEILAGLGRGHHSFKDSGIYVLPPGYRPLDGNENTPTQAHETELTFPVLVRCEAFTHEDYLEKIGELSGLVVDAIEGTPVFGTVSASGAPATVEQAYIGEGERPQIVEAYEDVPQSVVVLVTVVCKLVREEPA